MAETEPFVVDPLTFQLLISIEVAPATSIPPFTISLYACLPDVALAVRLFFADLLLYAPVSTPKTFP